MLYIELFSAHLRLVETANESRIDFRLLHCS